MTTQPFCSPASILIGAGLFAFMLSGCSEPAPAPPVETVQQPVADTIPEIEPVPSTTIGELEWMAENASTETSSSYCYEEDPANCEKYGRLYTWAAAKRACPDGWHLPTNEEWDNMIEELGGEHQAVEAMVDDATVGFSAKMAGSRSIKGDFRNLDLRGTFWTASKQDKDHAWCRIVRYQEGTILNKKANVDAAFSCRCVKDAPEEEQAQAE